MRVYLPYSHFARHISHDMLDCSGLKHTVYPIIGAVEGNRTLIERIDNPVYYQSTTTACLAPHLGNDPS